MQICSIKNSEFITPGSMVQYELKGENYAFLETRGKAIAQRGSYIEHIHPGEVIIGQKFQIHNAQDQCIHLRGFIFSCTSPLAKTNFSVIHKNVPISMKVSHIFDLTSCPIELIDQLSTCFPRILDIMSSDLSNKNTDARALFGKIDKRLITVHRYIRDQFQQPLTLQQLSELICCNPIYLSNTYSRVFRISPMKHIQNLRMEKARNLLTARTLNIGQIANVLGYISISQFSDLFKKYYQMTPRQYRANNTLGTIQPNTEGTS